MNNFNKPVNSSLEAMNVDWEISDSDVDPANFLEGYGVDSRLAKNSEVQKQLNRMNGDSFWDKIEISEIAPNMIKFDSSQTKENPDSTLRAHSREILEFALSSEGGIRIREKFLHLDNDVDKKQGSTLRSSKASFISADGILESVQGVQDYYINDNLNEDVHRMKIKGVVESLNSITPTSKTNYKMTRSGANTFNYSQQERLSNGAVFSADIENAKLDEIKVRDMRLAINNSDIEKFNQ